MKLKMFSVFDGKTGSFMRPFFDPHLGSALRSFEEACKEPTSPFAKFASDFVLYEVGEFDDETGATTSHSPVRQVATSLEHAVKPKMVSIPSQAVNANA